MTGKAAGPSCDRCGAPIVWMKSTSTDRWQPLDYSSDPNGTIRRRPGGYAQRLTGRDLVAAVADGELLWTDHRDTCTARRPHNPCPEHLRDTFRPKPIRRPAYRRPRL